MTKWTRDMPFKVGDRVTYHYPFSKPGRPGKITSRNAWYFFVTFDDNGKQEEAKPEFLKMEVN